MPKKSGKRQKTDKDGGQIDAKEQNLRPSKKGAKAAQTGGKTEKDTKEKEKGKGA